MKDRQGTRDKRWEMGDGRQGTRDGRQGNGRWETREREVGEIIVFFSIYKVPVRTNNSKEKRINRHFWLTINSKSKLFLTESTNSVRPFNDEIRTFVHMYTLHSCRIRIFEIKVFLLMLQKIEKTLLRIKKCTAIN